MFRCQLSNEFGLGHLSGEEVPHRTVVVPTAAKLASFETRILRVFMGGFHGASWRRYQTYVGSAPWTQFRGWCY